MELSDYVQHFNEKKEVKVDFHNHGLTGDYFTKKARNWKEKLWNLVYGEGFSKLTDVLDRTRKSGLDILYIANTATLRYEDWTNSEEVEQARKDGYEIAVGDYFVFAKKQGKIIALGKSQELPIHDKETKRELGHFLISGIRRNKWYNREGNTLDDTLGEIDDNELKIVDHPYARGLFGCGLFRGSEEGMDKADALEENGNFYFPFSLANIKVKRAAKKYSKPLLANADGHHPKDIGRTFNRINLGDYNYKTENGFRNSIHDAVRNKKFSTQFKPIPIWRVFHHYLMLGLHIFKDIVKEKFGKV